MTRAKPRPSSIPIFHQAWHLFPQPLFLPARVQPRGSPRDNAGVPPLHAKPVCRPGGRSAGLPNKTARATPPAPTPRHFPPKRTKQSYPLTFSPVDSAAAAAAAAAAEDADFVFLLTGW